MTGRTAKNVAARKAAAAAMQQAFLGVPAGLPAEEVPTASLGTVIVRASLLSEKLAGDFKQDADTNARVAAGQSKHEAATQSTVARTLETLARQVLGQDGKPIKTAAEWDVHGAIHQDEVLMLFNVIGRLSGGGSAEKN